MRYDDARARLIALPSRLPAAPELLTPAPVDFPADRAHDEPLFTRSSAVLVLVFPDAAGQACVVLTERPTGRLRHAGEISFPGGAAEEADEDPAATALREAREEIGLDPDGAGVEVVGSLGWVYIPVSGFRITPVVALAPRRPALTANPREVAAIIEAPLARFLPGAPVETVETTVRSVPLRFGAFPVGGRRVWGATARVLGQLGAVLGQEPVAGPQAASAAKRTGPDADGSVAALRSRPLREEDAGSVEAIGRTLEPWFGADALAEMVAEVAGGMHGRFAEDPAGQALGFVGWKAWTRPLPAERRGFVGWEAPDRTAEIVWLAVARRARGRGLGRRLVEEAATAARGESFRWLVLWTVADSAVNPPWAETRAFYRRLGFLDLVVDRRYRTPDGADRLLFGRPL